jgi:hypothetical protein
MGDELVPADVAEIGISTTPDDAADETSSLARDLARGYVDFVETYRTAWGISPADADTQLRHAQRADGPDRTAMEPPDQVSWWGLSSLIERDPEAGYHLWQRVKLEAQKELASGHRAARAIEHDSRPWERAQFLALRAAFREEWQPRGGVEAALIDAMAQAYTEYLTWLERLDVQATSESSLEDHHLKERGYYLTPRVTTAQAMEQSAAMVDRFHRMFVRSLRALRDLRRYNSNVIVQQAGQVNVGSQQVNVATSRSDHPAESTE